MFKRILLATAFIAATAGIASAAPISGSFSLTSFGGTYIGGTATALTATGIDFGLVGGPAGNGYGTAGSALIGNATGSFSTLGGGIASVADISLGATANPYTANPFISFGASSSIVVNFSSATISRTATSITVSGSATFADGVPADASNGMFTLSTSSQNGDPSNVQFTFTSNVSANAVPEPISLSILGAGLVGMGALRMRRKS